MYVCICNGISDKEIRKAVAAGAGTLQELHDRLGVASQCGTCAEHAVRIIEDTADQALMDHSLYFSAA